MKSPEFSALLFISGVRARSSFLVYEALSLSFWQLFPNRTSSSQKWIHFHRFSRYSMEVVGTGKKASGSDGITIIWDMKNCAIPVDCHPSQICGNIRLAIGIKFVKFYIFCDPKCQTSTALSDIPEAEPAAVMSYPPSDVPDFGDKEIIAQIHHQGALKHCDNHFLFITGDVDFCAALSMLRQRNIVVGVACLPDGSSPILRMAASYVRDWRKVARGIHQYLVHPRLQPITVDGSRNKSPIYIFWDTDTCIISDGLSAESMSKLTEKFQKLLREKEYYGHFRIFAYGDQASVSAKNQQLLQANFVTFQTVARGKDSRINARVDAVKMIQNDVSDRMRNRGGKKCFMIISNGDVKSIERLVKLKNHELILVRSTSSEFESMLI
ncbi:hypothetical protein OROGR_002666 [Orobanche gracilis]